MLAPRVLGIALSAGFVCGLPSLAQATNTPPSAAAQASQAKAAAAAAQRKQLADAQGAVETVKKSIAKVRARVEATFTGKEEYAKAKKDYEAAQAAYDAALKPALDAVRKKPEYLQAVADRQSAQATLDAINKPKPKADDSADSSGAETASDSTAATSKADAIKQAADQRFKAGLAIKRMEDDAMSDDSKVSAAKSKRDETKKAWDAAQAEVTEAVEADPEYIQLQTQLKTAEDQLANVRQQIAAQIKAQELANQAAHPPTHSPASGYNSRGR